VVPADPGMTLRKSEVSGNALLYGGFVVEEFLLRLRKSRVLKLLSL
jgi:hypothetical protein